MMRVKSRVGERISDILSAEKRGGLHIAMLDVMRTLVVCGGTSWKSELVRDLALFCTFKGGTGAVDEKELDEALGRLGKEGLVNVEKRMRADMSARGGAEDELITLVGLLATRNALARDRVMSSHVREQTMVLR
jgi:hypothetical protein